MKTAEELKEDIFFEAGLRENQLKFVSTWGLFSPKSIDDGSYLLIKHIDIEDGQTTLDLGCGYGAMGLSIAKACPNGKVHLVDKDFVAIQYASKNIKLNGLKNCKAYLSNAFSTVGDIKFDNIISNLPANVGNEMLYIMMHDAFEHLNPGGRLVVVTIAGLKEYIKRNFKAIFGNYKKLKQGRDHTVAQALKE